MNFLGALDKEYDWIAQGLYQRNADNKIIETVKSDSIYKTQSSDEIDGVMAKIPWMSAPYCKLYRTRLIKENTLQFFTDASVGEDRIFNIEYSQHVETIYVQPTVGYNYMTNEGSLLHRKYISPGEYIKTADYMNNVMKDGCLNDYMERFTAGFTMQHYVRAMSKCITYPKQVMTFSERIKFFVNGTTGIFGSEMFKKKPFGTLKMTGAFIVKYFKKAS